MCKFDLVLSLSLCDLCLAFFSPCKEQYASGLLDTVIAPPPVVTQHDDSLFVIALPPVVTQHNNSL
jgi:hypothetical protein